MISNHSITQYNIKMMYDAYKEAGMTSKEIELAITTLEPFLVQNVIDDLLQHVDDSKHEAIITLMNEGADLDAVTQALGLTKEAFEEELLHKLETYTHNLKQNLPALKAKVSSIQKKG